MKILIVEDYGPLRLALRDRLREEGYTVDEASDGEEAYDRILETEYAVIVLDLMLPGASGLDILRFVRKQDTDTAVLIVTARDHVSDRVAGLDMGADDYLVKPFALEEATARIRALLRRHFQGHQSRIQVDDLEIDLNGSTVRRGGKEIPLTGREFSLLRLLAYRRGRMVRRSEIWEEIYESNRDEIASNVVTVTLSRLRKKIDPPGSRPLIHTHRGLGYTLSERPVSAD